MASQQGGSEYDQSMQQYWAAVQQQQAQAQMQVQAGYNPQQMYAVQQQQQMWALQQAQAMQQAQYYGMQYAPQQPQPQQGTQGQGGALMQQLQAQQAAAATGVAVIDPNSPAYLQQLAMMQQQETAAYDPSVAPPPLFHRSEPGQARYSLRVNLLPWLPYRTLWLLFIVSIALVCVSVPLLRLSFLEDAESEPQGLRALLAVVITYALSRVVILMWGRAHPRSVSARTVGLLADASPILVVIFAGLASWFQPHQVRDIGNPDVTSSSFKVVTVLEVITKYAYLFVLIPLRFQPWGGMKAPAVPKWTCAYCGTANLESSTGAASRCVACLAFSSPQATASAAQAPAPQPAAPATIVSASADEDTGAGAGAGAGAGDGTDAAGAEAGAEAAGDAEGKPRSDSADSKDSDNQPSAEAIAAAIAGVGHAKETGAGAGASDLLDSGEVAVAIDEGNASGEAKAMSPSGVHVGTGEADMDGDADDHDTGADRFAPRTNRPKPVSNAVCALVPALGFVSEVLRVWDLWPAALSIVMVAPWLFLIWYDHGRRQWGSAGYLNLCLFAMYYLPTFGGYAMLEGLAKNRDDSGVEFTVLAVWVVVVVIVQWLWSVSAARAFTPIDAWPMTFLLNLFVEMLHRMILIQLTPFGGAFFAFILLHALVGFIRDSDLGTWAARKLFRVKQDLAQASDWAFTADLLEERCLRAQAGFAASALATMASFLAVGGDLVVTVGVNGCTEGLTRDAREEQLAGCVVMLVVAGGAYLLTRALLARRIRDGLKQQYAINWQNMDEGVRAALEDIATAKRLSWSWDTYVWVFSSAVVFCLVQPLAVASFAAHSVAPVVA